MRSLLLLAAHGPQGEFGTRDIVGLVFIGAAIIGIWLGFLYMQGETDRTTKRSDEVKRPGGQP